MTRANHSVQASDIENAYIRLWMKFNEACSGANVRRPKPKVAKGFERSNTSRGTICFRSFFCLPSWPYRSARSSERVDILVQSMEEVDCRRGLVVKSTVQVVYFDESSPSPVEPLLGLHYDFEEHVCGAHPVFHAQLGDTKFEPKDREYVGFRKEILAPKTKWYGRVRIPTPHMSLCAVLLTLAADHLPEQNYRALLSELRDCTFFELNVACTAMQESMSKNSRHWNSLHWYT